ncbi:MAG: cAMP-activated global transcriptional regulator CRP [Pseudomonadota bacterium]
MLDQPAVQAFIAQATKRSYPPKQVIIHAGDEPLSLFLILEGSMSVTVQDDDEREMVLAYLNPGEFFGEMCLFPEQKTRTAEVRTRTQALVAEIGYDNFRRFLREHPEIMLQLAGQLAQRLRATTQRLTDLAFLDVQGRVAHEILNLCRQPDAMPHARGTLVRISRQELARIVGCSREMAGRVLKKLSDDGTVNVQGRSIVVLGVQFTGVVKPQPIRRN